MLYVPSLNIDTPCACCHAKVNDMRMLCPISGEGMTHFNSVLSQEYSHRRASVFLVDPLYAFAFMQTFVDILREYFGYISAETLKENFDIVYQVHHLPNSTVKCSDTHLSASRRDLGRRRTPLDNIAERTARHRIAAIVAQQGALSSRSPWTSYSASWSAAVRVAHPVAKGRCALQQQ